MLLLTQDMLVKPFFQQIFHAWLLSLGALWSVIGNFIDAILLIADICKYLPKFKMKVLFTLLVDMQK